MKEKNFKLWIVIKANNDQHAKDIFEDNYKTFSADLFHIEEIE